MQLEFTHGVGFQDFRRDEGGSVVDGGNPGLVVEEQLGEAHPGDLEQDGEVGEGGGGVGKGIGTGGRVRDPRMITQFASKKK